jgi:hypothetical protein
VIPSSFRESGGPALWRDDLRQLQEGNVYERTEHVLSIIFGRGNGVVGLLYRIRGQVQLMTFAFQERLGLLPGTSLVFQPSR